jgi:hypothetical protein
MGRVRAERQRLLRCLGHSEADRQESTLSERPATDPTQTPRPPPATLQSGHFLICRSCNQMQQLADEGRLRYRLCVVNSGHGEGCVTYFQHHRQRGPVYALRMRSQG